jgi:hypothetical protein
MVVKQCCAMHRARYIFSQGNHEQAKSQKLIRPDGYASFRIRPIAVEPLRRYLRAHFSHRHA